MSVKTRALASGAMIAALYAVLTVVMAPLSYGPVQCRVAEALTLLPLYLPEAVPGLFVGCLVANAFGGYGLIDLTVGSCATLLAAALTQRAPNLWLGALSPVLVNAIVVGSMLHLVAQAPLGLTVLYVGVGEAGACFLVGIPLMRALMRQGILCGRHGAGIPSGR